MHYGFIGLGNLGGKLAARLADAAFTVTAFDLDAALVESLESHGVSRAPGCITSRIWLSTFADASGGGKQVIT